MDKNYQLFKISAFIDKALSFDGNIAGVCLLDKWLSDEQMQAIAAKAGLPETAFLVGANATNRYLLRWFTPEIEMDLCGHATLASAHFLFNHYVPGKSEITFDTISGPLTASKKSDIIFLNFPSRKPSSAILPPAIVEGIGKAPRETLKSRDYILVYDNEDDVINLRPNRGIIDRINLDPGGIVVTARGKTADFVSRYFTPQAGIFEDPVTGSAHCSLIPYWSGVLGKSQLIAHQLSESGGKLYCTDLVDRVAIGGYCATL